MDEKEEQRCWLGPAEAPASTRLTLSSRGDSAAQQHAAREREIWKEEGDIEGRKQGRKDEKKKKGRDAEFSLTI